MKIIWRVSQYLFRYPLLFALVQVMAIGMTLLLIGVPMVTKSIIAGVEQSGTTDNLLWGVLTIVGLYLGSELLNGLRIVFNNTLEQRVLFDMRRDLHQKLLILQESEPVRASREAEFIPAYPDDNDLSRQQQRQQALNSDESTRPFAEVSQMTGEEQSRGRFLDLYA